MHLLTNLKQKQNKPISFWGWPGFNCQVAPDNTGQLSSEYVRRLYSPAGNECSPVFYNLWLVATAEISSHKIHSLCGLLCYWNVTQWGVS